MFRTLMLFACTALAGKTMADTPKVAVDIAPVHSLVAQVMEGIAEPALVIPPGSTPHDHAMRPSEARALQSADVVFWVGPELTPWMARPLSALSSDAVLVELLEVNKTVHRSFRDLADQHDASDDHEDHDADADHESHAHHDHEGLDPHAWLDPVNAHVWVLAIAETLARVDPDNATTYRSNAGRTVGDLLSLQAEIQTDLAGMTSRRFITFHDAYQYFEERFGLTSSGTVSLGDATAPGPARLAALKRQIAKDGIDCAFAEPQFNTRLIEAAIEGTDAQILVLDPIGVALEAGPDLYSSLLRDMVANYQACIKGS